MTREQMIDEAVREDEIRAAGVALSKFKPTPEEMMAATVLLDVLGWGETPRRATASDDGILRCPFCACGPTRDWKDEAPLRCSGCRRPLNLPEGLGQS